MKISLSQFTNEMKQFLTVPNESALKAFHSGQINMFAFNKIKNIELFEIDRKQWCVYVPGSILLETKPKPELQIKVPKTAKKLYDYQSNVINKLDAIETANKMVVMSTGTGKSIVMSHLVIRHALPTLLVLPTIELLKQQKKVLEDFWLTVWMYGNWSKELKDITVITTASLSQMSDKELDSLNYKLVIVDELQKALWEKIRHALIRLDNELMYSFSATPYNATMNKESVKRFFGESIEYVLINITPDIYIAPYKNPYKLSPDNYTQDRTDSLDKDHNRLDEQIETIKTVYTERKNIMVLYDRVFHSEYVYKALKKKYKQKIYILTGEMKDADRKKNLEWFKKNWGVLIASDAVAGTGLDAPRIDTVCIFFPNKFDWRVIQMVGRGLRKHPGKKDAVIIDWQDSALIYQFYKRYKAYKKTYGIKQAHMFNKFISEIDLDI